MHKGRYLYIDILSGANFTAYSVFLNNATTYLVREVGLTSAIVGFIFSLQGVGQLFGYFIWGAIADQFSRKIPAIEMLFF